jgi:hypothetical protein
MYALFLAVLACFVIGILDKRWGMVFGGIVLLLVFLVGGFFTLLTYMH